MPVYGILGDGEVSTQFLTDTLDALRDRAALKDEDFWVMLPYNPEGVTDGIGDVFDWVEKNEVWARAYSAGDENEDEQPAVEEFVVVKRGTPAQRMIKGLVEASADGDAELLVILHTLDPDEPDDRDEEVNTAIVAANQQEIPVRQLNNGMMELDFTETEEDEASEGPSEDEVRKLGVDADAGDDEAIEALTALGVEYEMDVADEPYSEMSWTEFAEEILTVDAEKANAEPQDVPEELQPQKHDREKLEKMQLRQLRALAVGESWGKPSQSFPAWFLIDHLANGTVPTEAQLDGTEDVPKDRPSGGSTAAKRGRTPKAEQVAESGSTYTVIADLFETLAGHFRSL